MFRNALLVACFAAVRLSKTSSFLSCDQIELSFIVQYSPLLPLKDWALFQSQGG